MHIVRFFGGRPAKPECLQVLLTLHARMFDRLPFLHDKHPQFLEQILPLLKLEFYASGEHVLWQHDISTEMYFVVEGTLEVRRASATHPSLGMQAVALEGALVSLCDP